MDTLALKKRRCEMGYFTQSEMARALGMTRANYGNRERGLIRFRGSEIPKVCELLDWTLEEGVKVLL